MGGVCLKHASTGRNTTTIGSTEASMESVVAWFPHVRIVRSEHPFGPATEFPHLTRAGGNIVKQKNFLYHQAPMLLTPFHLEDHGVTRCRHPGNSGFGLQPGCDTESPPGVRPGPSGFRRSPLEQADTGPACSGFAFCAVAGYRVGSIPRCPGRVRNQGCRQADGHWPKPADARVRGGRSIALAGPRRCGG